MSDVGRIIRHRFVPGENRKCGEQFPGAEPCGLSQYATFHYHDGDHPYSGEGNGAGRGCTWELQDGARVGMPCGLGSLEGAHDAEREAAGNWQLRPPAENVDRTAEVAVGEAATWAASSAAYLQSSSSSTEPVLSSVAQAFLNGGPVGLTGETVRQWWYDGNAGPVTRTEWDIEIEETLSSLWATGAAYDHYVWWKDGARVVRIVWGPLLGLSEDEVASALTMAG